MIAAVVVVSALLIGAAGRVHRRRLDRDLAARLHRGASGIIVGAETIALDGTNGAAILLLHGGGDTPQTMGHLATELNARGYTVLAPLLPGHGRDLTAFAAHDGNDWYQEARDRYATLRKKHSWVGVVGLSMGGALASRLAAETPDLGALVLASPYLNMPALGDIAAQSSWLWGALVPTVRTSSSLSVLDPEARAVSLGYGAFTSQSLRALRATAINGRNALPRVKAPTLIVQSTTDNRVSTAHTEAAFELLGSREKAIEWIEGAGHVITVDYGWQRVVGLAADWMDAHRT